MKTTPTSQTNDDDLFGEEEETEPKSKTDDKVCILGCGLVFTLICIDTPPSQGRSQKKRKRKRRRKRKRKLLIQLSWLLPSVILRKLVSMFCLLFLLKV